MILLERIHKWEIANSNFVSFAATIILLAHYILMSIKLKNWKLLNKSKTLNTDLSDHHFFDILPSCSRFCFCSCLVFLVRLLGFLFFRHVAKRLYDYIWKLNRCENQQNRSLWKVLKIIAIQYIHDIKLLFIFFFYPAYSNKKKIKSLKKRPDYRLS